METTKLRWRGSAQLKQNLVKSMRTPGQLSRLSGTSIGKSLRRSRFQGLSKAWNGADDDNWFLHDSHTYTLIHFAGDDPAISAATLKWLPGWWEAGEEFYFVDERGRAHSSRAKPLKREQRLGASAAVGYYFEGDRKIVFVWRLPSGLDRIERWTAPSGTTPASRTVEGLAASLSRVF
jgi:hypothetical protein